MKTYLTRKQAADFPEGVIMNNNADGFLSKKSAATFTAHSQRALDYARASGALPFYKVGRKIIFRQKDLENWLARFRVDVSEVS